MSLLDKLLVHKKYPIKFFISKNEKDTIDLICEQLIEMIKNKPNLILGVAPGSTVNAVLEELVIKVQKAKISFKEVSIFGLDDFYTNNSSKIFSFKNSLTKSFINKVNIQLQNVNFINAKNYKQFDKLIKQKGGLDLILIGIGQQGQLAYNESGTPLTAHTRITELDEATKNANLK